MQWGNSRKDRPPYRNECTAGLKEHEGISTDTVHFLMLPPRKNTTRASRYKGLIPVKVPKYRMPVVNRQLFNIACLTRGV